MCNLYIYYHKKFGSASVNIDRVKAKYSTWGQTNRQTDICIYRSPIELKTNNTFSFHKHVLFSNLNLYIKVNTIGVNQEARAFYVHVTRKIQQHLDALRAQLRLQHKWRDFPVASLDYLEIDSILIWSH